MVAGEAHLVEHDVERGNQLLAILLNADVARRDLAAVIFCLNANDGEEDEEYDGKFLFHYLSCRRECLREYMLLFAFG